MSRRRHTLLGWVDQGLIRPEARPAAARMAGLLATGPQWWRALDLLTRGLGVLMLLAGVLFFFAWNWEDLHRFAKFGLLGVGVGGAALLAAALGPRRLGGQLALLAAAALLGPLLGVIGQVYQSGADPWQLFAGWTVLILPWAAVGRFAPLWLLWLGLLNLTLSLAVPELLSSRLLPWTLAATNTTAWLLLRVAARRGIRWAEADWLRDLLGVVAIASVTCLLCIERLDGRDWWPAVTLVLGLGFAAGMVRSLRQPPAAVPLVALAIGSVIVVATWIVFWTIRMRAIELGLLLGILVLGAQSAWLIRGLRETLVATGPKRDRARDLDDDA